MCHEKLSRSDLIFLKRFPGFLAESTQKFDSENLRSMSTRFGGQPPNIRTPHLKSAMPCTTSRSCYWLQIKGPKHNFCTIYAKYHSKILLFMRLSRL